MTVVADPWLPVNWVRKFTVWAWARTARLKVIAAHANTVASVREDFERFIEYPPKRCLIETTKLQKTDRGRVRGPLPAVRDCYFVKTNCGLLLSVPDAARTETVSVFGPQGTVDVM